MHFVRRDYVFFYDKGIVCYKSTPVPFKKTIKHDSIDEIILNNHSNINEQDCQLINFIDEQHITLVPTKPLNLIDPTLEKIKPLDTIHEPEPKEIRPNIALNTLYSLVYPVSVTGNTYNVSPKKRKVKVKHEKYGLFYKICERDDEKTNKTKCRKCTFTNIFDKEDYLYNCPETINTHRPIDLYLNRLNVNKYHNLDDNDLDELDYIEPTNREQRSISEVSECVQPIELTKSISNKYPTIYSIASSLASEPAANECVIERQPSKLIRILSNEEICEVIESPNVIRSIESFHIQLSRLSSKTTFRNDSNIFTRDLISQDSKDAFTYPLEAKTTKVSNLPSTKSANLSIKLEESEDSDHIPSEDKSEVGSINNVTIYNRASSVRSVKKPVSKIQSIKATESNESFHKSVSNIIEPSPSIQSIKQSNSKSLVSILSNDVPEQSLSKIDSYKSNISAESVKSDPKLDLDEISSDNHETTIEQKSVSIEEEDVFVPTIRTDKSFEPDQDESKEYKIHDHYPFSDQKSEEPNPEKVEYLKNELEADVISEEETIFNEDNKIDIESELESEKDQIDANSIDEVDELEDKDAKEEPSEPPSTYDKKHTIENVAYEVYYDSNKEVIRPLKDNRNNVLVKGFNATVYIVNSNKTATSSLCTIMFNYEEDLLIIKSASDIFEIKATDLTSEEIPTSPGSPILLKITLNNNLFSAIVIQSEVGKNLEILAGTIGWVNKRRKAEFKDKAPRMNIRKSLFAGLKNNKRVDKGVDQLDRKDNKRGKMDRKAEMNKNKLEKAEVKKDKESVRTGGLFSRIRRKRAISNKAK